MENAQNAASSQTGNTAPEVTRGQPDIENKPHSETPFMRLIAALSRGDASREDGPAAPDAGSSASAEAGESRPDEAGQGSASPRRPKKKTDTVVIPNAGRMLPIPRHASEPTDRRAEYRRWLEGKSKDDLIDLLLNAEDPAAATDATEKFAKVMVADTLAGEADEGYSIPADMKYLRLPVLRKVPINEPAPAWRIVLVSLDQSSRPLGLQIDSEITIGRAVGNTVPDLDLTPFGAKSKGVSRIHARLRPSMNKLVLVDSDSSNGTFWNRLRLEAETEQPLKEGDVIAFGRVNFLLKIVKMPNAMEPRTLI